MNNIICIYFNGVDLYFMFIYLFRDEVFYSLVGLEFCKLF